MGRDQAKEQSTVTGFSDRQINALRRSLNSAHIRTRRVEGRELSYIEGWQAISEANRIFGFDRWDRETVESRCVLARENRGSLHTVYVAKVRITVRSGGEVIVREGYGTGESLGGGTLGEAHERALKMAETDATKRALATFGKPFGLGLYLSPRRPPQPPRFGYDPNTAPPIPDHQRRRTLQRLGPNGRYHVPPRFKIPIDPALCSLPTSDQENMDSPVSEEPELGDPGPAVHQDQANDRAPPSEAFQGVGVQPAPASTTVPLGERSEPGPGEEGRLLIEWTKRRREPAHLKFVASQPCLVCGRAPSDAHHLRFAQPRALGRKVSDEFTVPLCRVHHRELHRFAKEVDWWEAWDRDVDPLEIAKGLWEQSHQKTCASDTKP